MLGIFFETTVNERVDLYRGIVLLSCCSRQLFSYVQMWWSKYGVSFFSLIIYLFIPFRFH